MSNCKRVRSNLLLQDVFLRDCATAKDLNTSYDKQKYYFELRETTVSNGIKQELVKTSYDITPEVVKSYASSADYRNDPAGAILRGHKGNNLGDIRDMQRVLDLDSPAIQALYAELKEKIEAAKVEQKKEPAPAPAPEGGGTNG